MKTKYLFVYGTLMSGMEASELLSLAGARFVAPAYIHGELYDLGEYPAAIRASAADTTVGGELWELPYAEAIQALDEYERCREGDVTSLFERQVVSVTRMDTGACQKAWTYFLSSRRSSGEARLIESGDYRLARSS